MRIWCQSAGAFGKDAAWAPYEQGLKRHIREVVRPDTIVDLYGTASTIPGLARHRGPTALAQFQAVRNAIRAEEQGYNAFVLLSTSDGGAAEIREMVKIPVVFITETCLHLACLLADKFAFFTNNESLLIRLTEQAKQYGLTDRMVTGGCLDLGGYSDIMEMFQNPKPHIDTVVKVVKEIGARGANLLFPAAGALNQWLVDNDLRQVDGISILDASGAALKMAELMVDLKAIGINRSPRYYSSPQPEVLKALKKCYGV